MRKEYDFSKAKARKNPCTGKVKKGVGIHLSPEVLDYFKGLAEETGRPDQNPSICTFWMMPAHLLAMGGLKR
jgi:hypothetical protein